MSAQGRGQRSKMLGTLYVAEHRLLSMAAYAGTIIANSIFNPVMYLFALGIGIGSYVSPGSMEGGISYLTYVGPALLVGAAVNAAFAETSFPVMEGFKWTRVFFSMNATPLEPRHIVGGVLLAATVRIVGTVVVFWIVLGFFGALGSPLSFLVVPLASLAGMGFGSFMAGLAASFKDDDGWFALINRMVVAPLFLFSGTFFPLESMPLGLQWIGWISPLWHATELGRWACYGAEFGLGTWLLHLGYLVALYVLGSIFASRQFTRRLMG